MATKVVSYADGGASSQDSEVCSDPDRLRRTHSDSSASLSSSSSGDSDDDGSDSATQSEGGGHQHSSSSRKAAVVRARKVSSERVKRVSSNNGSVRWTDEMVCNIYSVHVRTYIFLSYGSMHLYIIYLSYCILYQL